ncbi:MAG: hypothetical protein LBR36_03290 [Bacteroidales bacterium]|jgi:hypothetical protein|nr:hypothetical protein [Bacteroidales bacterium]
MIHLEFSLWEVLMLLCFAISWPVSIIKALRTKFVLGKSPLFMLIIFVGYIFGIIHKFTVPGGADIVTILWFFNAFLVALDLFLYCRYAGANRRQLRAEKKAEKSEHIDNEDIKD